MGQVLLFVVPRPIRVGVVGWVFLLGPAAWGWSAEAARLHSAALTITAAELQRHVEVLAADSMEGRAAGSRGGYAAGHYIASVLRDQGLSPAGDSGSYFQLFQNGYRNVLGMLPGTDPKVADQLVVVGAHYDHVGYGSRTNSLGSIGYVHNGADDNASGVAAVLELLDACVRSGLQMRRTVLFAFWDAEEKGLLGSQYWLQQLPDKTKVVAAINLDMVGRLREERLEVYGSRTAVGFRQLVAMANATTHLKLDFLWEMKANSDHHSFFVAGIPTLMFHTGLHADYHRPSDDTDKISVEGIRRVAELVLHVMTTIADQDDRLRYRATAQQEDLAAQKVFERPTAVHPGRFGMRWKWVGSPMDMVRLAAGEERSILPSDGAVQIVEVLAGSAAEQVGLQAGQWIIGAAGRSIRSANDFQRAVYHAVDHLPLTVVTPGHGGVHLVELPLWDPPLRAGISWKLDDAEPGVFYLTYVAPGSPADQADLRHGDRIYAVDGHRAHSSEELRRIIVEADEAVELLVERQGRLRSVRLVLP